jgi:hypothetical protein
MQDQLVKRRALKRGEVPFDAALNAEARAMLTSLGADHDDELAPHALYEVASLLDVHPDTDLVYSDEDKIDEGEARKLDIRKLHDPKLPKEDEVKEHFLSGHMPFRSWCPHCVKGKGKERV